MNKRLKKKLHKKFAFDVLVEISFSGYWREALFGLGTGESLTVCRDSALPLPKYIKPTIRRYNLSYKICTVEDCPEEFDADFVIFELSPRRFLRLKYYSGNNPAVVF